MPKMIPARDARSVQDDTAAHIRARGWTLATAPLNQWRAVPETHLTPYGGQLVTGTGRATCRGCGQRIQKGDRAIRFAHSFTYSGGYTATDIQVHLVPCTPGG